MGIIFDDKNVEGNDMDNRMKFPSSSRMRELPSACRNPGDSARLQVKDEEGTQWPLTYKNCSGRIYFTDGWREFRKRKGIMVGHKIILSKDDDCFGSGAQYKITVRRN